MLNQILPSRFVQGYFNAILSRWGNSWMMSAINAIPLKGKSNSDLEKIADLFRDLYHNRLPKTPQLGYKVIRTLFGGLEYTCNNEQRCIKAMTFMGGQDWWVGGQYSASADREFILYTLLDFAGFAPQQTLWWDVTCEAMQMFSDKLAEKGGIQSNIQITNTALTIHFSLCPFCTNQSENCRFFQGVIDSFLKWLYAVSKCSDKHEFDRLLINPSHTIILQCRTAT
jgi:hypothetical protein